MAILTQKTYILERKNGRIISETLFPSCEIAKRLTPFQKEALAEEVISKYLLYMEQTIESEIQNDVFQDESAVYRRLLNHAGIAIQIVEKI